MTNSLTSCVVARPPTIWSIRWLRRGEVTRRKTSDWRGTLRGRLPIAAVPRIIYLGGLGELGDGLSEHLRSRREVEQALASTGVPVTTLRAAMIIGSGSASFEILRYLVERLPVMITPRWVQTECQPVAITDVLYWLVRVPERCRNHGSRHWRSAHKDVLSYRRLMQIMAEELQLRPRLIIGVPVLTPRLSSAGSAS